MVRAARKGEPSRHAAPSMPHHPVSPAPRLPQHPRPPRPPHPGHPAPPHPAQHTHEFWRRPAVGGLSRIQLVGSQASSRCCRHLAKHRAVGRSTRGPSYHLPCHLPCRSSSPVSAGLCLALCHRPLRRTNLLNSSGRHSGASNDASEDDLRANMEALRVRWSPVSCLLSPVSCLPPPSHLFLLPPGGKMPLMPTTTVHDLADVAGPIPELCRRSMMVKTVWLGRAESRVRGRRGISISNSYPFMLCTGHDMRTSCCTAAEA